MRRKKKKYEKKPRHFRTKGPTIGADIVQVAHAHTRGNPKGVT